jgi:hypothetical protein
MTVNGERAEIQSIERNGRSTKTIQWIEDLQNGLQKSPVSK